ncbi:glycosyltransferase family 2 protein [Microbacterium sp. 18062]|uniref:glycosyltransferase family 2 protein n=1 Tax=Microbacterium sp. 18062 TaxID=2681410 RepID=UPI00135682C5|nr:glycosyltransferase family 2 protein [Microbacterium sp. 18062]
MSAIIPTTGRSELARAISSVRSQQTSADLEVVVVFDGSPDAEVPLEAEREADRVVRTGGFTGGSSARNAGVAAATGDYVAFLDDDDQWLPSKLELQLELVHAMENPERAVIAGRHRHVPPDGEGGSAPVPSRLIREGESVERYLFYRRTPGVGRASMYTSTLFCARTLATEVQWDPSLKRHQDWDWLVRLGRAPGVTFGQVAESVAIIQTGSTGSISAGTDWVASLSWAESLLTDSSVRVDFLTAQTLRYAIASRSGAGVKSVLSAIGRSRKIPSPGPVIMGVAGVLSRASIERMATAPKKGFR